MSNPDDAPRPVTMTTADILNHRYSFDDHIQRWENDYLMGLHHGVLLSSDLADDASSLAEARRILIRAERAAGQYRDRRRHPGRPPIVDLIRRKPARLPAGAGSH
jgi:hypothetical protein